MFSSKTLLIAVVATLLTVAVLTEAAWPQARWKRPTGFSEQGDRRYLMQKYMKKVTLDAKEYDPVPPLMPHRRRSRAYHFQYGPIYPTHHQHIKDAETWFPADHQYYY